MLKIKANPILWLSLIISEGFDYECYFGTFKYLFPNNNYISFNKQDIISRYLPNIKGKLLFKDCKDALTLHGILGKFINNNISFDSFKANFRP